MEFENWTYDEVLSALESHIDFSNFPISHPRFSNSRKAQFGYVKVDTADAVIHAFVGEKKKSYQIFTNQSVSEITDLDFDRKLCKKGESFGNMYLYWSYNLTGVPHAAAAQVENEAILSLLQEPGMLKVEFNKLQTKSHSIKMIQVCQSQVCS